MAIFLAGKAVCYRILAFFCYRKLHFKCESADLYAVQPETETAKILRSEDSEKTEKLLKLLNSAEHEEERQEEDSPIAQA